MIKKTGILALAFCLFLTILSPVLVQAQDGLTVLDSSIQVEFPARLTFNVSARSDVDITDIRLHYVVDRASFAQVTSEVYIEFEPTTKAEISWVLEMLKIGGLPPGASLYYWWTVEDARGNKAQTSSSRVQFDDTRYTWNRLIEGKITLYWYRGNESFAQEIMTTAHQVLARLLEDTGAYLQKPIKIYIYANPGDLRGSMIHPQEWTGGVTFTRHGIIAIGISTGNLDWGKRAIAHELAHLVVHQMIFNPYSDLPTWLSEGLAMYAEGPLSSEFTTLLSKAVTENSLISVRSLSSPFSAYAEESLLGYAQSYSLAEYLITSQGQSKILELLNTFSQGSSYDAALIKVYNFDTEGLDTLWRDYVTATSLAR
jgi:hypothetical protein